MKPGDVVDGRFVLQRLAGTGGMGAVFRALDKRSGEVVAVKVLLREAAQPTADRPEEAEDDRFEREARVLAGLSHPAVVRYVAHGVTPGGDRYLAMEWLDGEVLSTRLAKGVLSLSDSVTLAKNVADGLGAVHACGVIHRDLKPTNLFLVGGAVERVKLLDFGLARSDGLPRMTRSGALLGTIGYMAPEQARSDHFIDARVDVFTLGCVLFECLVGKPAFAGEHVMAILAKILFQETPRVRSLRPEIPWDLDALIARMLAKDPLERPRDGRSVAMALAALGVPQELWDALAPASVRADVLTGGERRALSVVLIGGETPSAVASADTLDKATVLSMVEVLRREAQACGGRLEHLADGSAVVTIAEAGLATDQAAHAARCALALRSHAGSRPMALATGHGELSGSMPAGDVIDRAARTLATRAPSPSDWTKGSGGLIAVDRMTAGLLDARFEVKEIDGVLYLLGARELAEGARTLLGKPTVCVGRDWEIGALQQIFAECVDEPVARAVLVTAGAGMGKSRLAHELIHAVRQRGDVALWIGRGDSLRMSSALGLLGQVLRGACGLRDGEPLSVRQDRLRARVLEHVAGGEARRVSGFIGEIAGTPLPDDDSALLRAARMDARLMGDEMQRAFEDFLAAECSARPVLLILDDLHWGDASTVRFIDRAMRNLHDRPWMVLALGRPELYDLFPKLWADRRLEEIRLQQLGRKASERLVRQVIGDGLSAEAIRRLVEQADGNAFYLEELVRAAAEHRAEVLPETVVAMVEWRLGGLDVDARRALRAASIFGDVFWSGGVAALLGSKRAASVDKKLAALVEQEMLVRRSESRFPGEEELAFRHALLREGSYATLTEEDSVLGHRLAGTWLLERGESDPLVLAGHFERGRDPARAGSFYLRAVQQAHNGGDTDTAIARAERALGSGIPEEHRIALLGMLCAAYVHRPNSLGTAEPYIAEVMRLSAPGSEPWAQAISAKLVAALHRGDREHLIGTLDLLNGVQPTPGAAPSLAVALVNAIYILDTWGQIESAGTVLARLHALVDPIADEEPIAAGLVDLIYAMRAAYAEEDPWTGLQRAEAGKTRLQAAHYRRGVSIGKVYAGMNLWALGALAQAERELSEITSADDELGTIHPSLPLLFVLADQGALVEAHALAVGLVASVEARRHRINEGRGRWALSDMLRRRGKLDAALAEVTTALELLSIAPLDHVAALATRAAVLLAQGSVVEALGAAEEAIRKCDAMRACGFFRGAFVRLTHAECLMATGDREGAGAAIARAAERLRRNAARIGDPSLQRSFLDGVPENVRTLALAQQWA